MQPRSRSRILSYGSLFIWGGFALVMILAPLVFSSSLAITILSQIGIAVIACLSYNMLLGQGGMLSFGHAVYTGFGSFLAIHALNMVGAGKLLMPVSLVPLAGGMAGLVIALLLGFVSTKKSGTTFAMITLGVGELAFSLALMVPEFFGGEGGISGNRVVGEPFFGFSLGTPRQAYYLIAVYTFFCVAAMFAFTLTPLGRMLNAVRDNSERVEFIGYDARRIRYLTFIAAGFFAGIAGGLAALNFEIVTAEVMSASRSGAYLLFTFVGGTTYFFGPIIGAVLMVLAIVLFSGITKAWLLYLGVIFMLMVLYAPGGVASIVVTWVRIASSGRLREMMPRYMALVGATCLFLAGASVLIEMIYHIQLDGVGGDLHFFGMNWDTRIPWHWLAGFATACSGGALFARARRRLNTQWASISEGSEAVAPPTGRRP